MSSLGYTIFPFEYFLARYRECGLRVIPIEGRKMPDGTWNPKDPGYSSWEIHKATDKELLNHISWKYRWSAICGPASGDLLVLDYDLEDEFGSTEAARKWRQDRIWALRDMETPVVFTPSGGCHVWFRAPNGIPEPGRLARVTYGTFPCEPDLVKFSGHVLIPPSRLLNLGYYLFMDQDSVLPVLAKSIRTVR